MTEPNTIPGLENDAEGARIVAEELKLLATVTRALGAAEAKKATQGNPDDDALMELREQVETAKPEDLPSLFEQMHTMGALRAQRGRGAIGLLDGKSPYFGHLRLEETLPGQKQLRRRDVLIGSRSYVDAEAGVRVVDWRNAPVSRIFYRYREEDDYEERLGDSMVEGTVAVRRSVAIADGELRRVSAPQGTFIRQKSGEWKRLAASSARLSTDKKRLGVGADGRPREDKLLPEIAAMLDSAQYDLITREGAGLVAIQGSAGSGKTTVGLHRVAYLAAHNPNRFRAERMMVVVPNEALIHYVSRVLPSLGVDGVPITTFPRFARRMVIGLFPNLPSLLREDTPSVVARMKSGGGMLRAIDTLASRMHATIQTRVTSAMAKWEGGDLVVKAFEATKDQAPDVRVTQFAQWVAGKRELGGNRFDAVPAVTRGAVEKLGQDLRQKTRNVLSLWDELCTNPTLLAESFQGDASVSASHLTQFQDWCVRQSRIRTEDDRDGETPAIDEEDMPLLLRLWQKIRGPLLNEREEPIKLAHLFVDEVQDHSAVALRVLLDLASKEQSVTLAGDVAQRMLDEGDERGEFAWTDLLEELGVQSATVDPLKVSYRSTAEITTFARAVLGTFAHEAEPIATRHGPTVEGFQFASVGEEVAFLADALKELAADEPDANVAVIARFPQQAEVVFEGLERAEVPRARRVAKQDFTWEAGVDVTDVRQTKGLEFDEVVLVETTKESFPDSPASRHALYVGATRAAHQLWCMSSGTQSPVVEAALEVAAQAAAAAAAEATNG